MDHNFVCENCGGSDIEGKFWLNLGLKKITWQDCGEIDCEEIYCNDCEDHHPLTTKEEPY